MYWSSMEYNLSSNEKTNQVVPSSGCVLMDADTNYRPLIRGEIIEDGDEWYTESPFKGKTGWLSFHTGDTAVGREWGIESGWCPARRKIKLRHAVDVF